MVGGLVRGPFTVLPASTLSLSCIPADPTASRSSVSGFAESLLTAVDGPTFFVEEKLTCLAGFWRGWLLCLFSMFCASPYGVPVVKALCDFF